MENHASARSTPDSESLMESGWFLVNQSSFFTLLSPLRAELGLVVKARSPSVQRPTRGGPPSPPGQGGLAIALYSNPNTGSTV